MWVPHIEPPEFNRRAESFEPDICVREGRDPVPTDYFDPDGNRIYWVPEPIGFHHPLGDE